MELGDRDVNILLDQGDRRNIVTEHKILRNEDGEVMVFDGCSDEGGNRICLWIPSLLFLWSGL
jgi:hypothetical protein